jgi:uncharacterized peroxidase-related enzyme
VTTTAADAAISRFPVPEIADLPADLRERVLAVQERTGFVPNVFLALAHRPDELRAFVAYHDAVMEREGGLTKAEREMVVVATSAASRCTYCVVAHGAILRVRAKDPALSDLVAVDHRQAPLTGRQHAMLDFAVKLSRTPELVGEDDHRALRDAGWDDDAVWDISAVVALFALSNRMAHALSLRPNPEFHALGRTPAAGR